MHFIRAQRTCIKSKPIGSSAMAAACHAAGRLVPAAAAAAAARHLRLPALCRAAATKAAKAAEPGGWGCA